jgi:hypothetical protein
MPTFGRSADQEELSTEDDIPKSVSVSDRGPTESIFPP